MRQTCSFWAKRTLCIACLLLGGCTLDMPGKSFAGRTPEATPPRAALASELERDARMLAGTIGERNMGTPDRLREAEEFLSRSLKESGYTVNRRPYTCRGAEVANLEVELRGKSRPDEIVVIGAHYDSVGYRSVHTPGADDNASGCAGLLALTRQIAGSRPDRTVRFVLFVNEEPPYFWTEEMGSLVYARACKERGDNIAAMLSLEMIGYFADDEGSQDYPPLVGLMYPSSGNFIAFIGVEEAGPLVQKCVGAFRGAVDFPSEGAALPRLIPRIASSDHWSFWKLGYPSAMVTDTAIYRNKNYHKATDTPETLDYAKMALVVEGLAGVVNELARAEARPARPIANTPDPIRSYSP
jgi:hypothetical protein